MRINYKKVGGFLLGVFLRAAVFVLIYHLFLGWHLYSWHKVHWPELEHDCRDHGLAVICTVRTTASMGEVRQFYIDDVGVYVCAPTCLWIDEPRTEVLHGR